MLKGIVSRVVPLEYAPFSETEPDEPIEGIISPSSLVSRMVPDLIYQLAANKTLIYLKRRLQEFYGLRKPHKSNK